MEEFAQGLLEDDKPFPERPAESAAPMAEAPAAECPMPTEAAVEESPVTEVVTAEADGAEAAPEVSSADATEQAAEPAPAEEPVSEDAPVSEETPVEEEKPAEPAPFDEMQKLIYAHNATVMMQLKRTKEKDDNVGKLAKQLDAYRTGFAEGSFKSIALNVIAYREDCLKALRDMAEREMTEEELKKYIKYLFMDFEDLLTNLGIEDDGERWLYNKVNINAAPPVPLKELTVPEVTYPTLEQRTLTTIEDVMAYLQESEALILETLKANTVLDAVLSQCIARTAVYEKGLYQVVLYPAVRKLIASCQKTTEKCLAAIKVLPESDGKAAYFALLADVVADMDEVLTLCNVTVESELPDAYTPPKHKMMRAVKTENPEQNGMVAKRYCDCYLLGDKIIYPAKVEVYKA